MGRCITENDCRLSLWPQSWVTPGYDDTRIMSFDEVLQRYKINPIYGSGSYYLACADSMGNYYSHYENEDYGGGRILSNFLINNSSGTGWMAGSYSLGNSIQWSPYTFATAGANSYSDSYTNTYNIMQRYSPAADAPAAYTAYNSNVASNSWVLPAPEPALYIANLWVSYGGWSGVSNIWTSMEGSPASSTAVRVNFISPTPTATQVSKTNQHSVIPFRTYNDGPAEVNGTSTVTSTGSSSYVVLHFVNVRSEGSAWSPVDTRSHFVGERTLQVAYTDPNNPSTNPSTFIPTTVSLYSYQSGTGFSIVYPRRSYDYQVRVTRYWDANYGTNLGSQGDSVATIHKL